MCFLKIQPPIVNPQIFEGLGINHWVEIEIVIFAPLILINKESMPSDSFTKGAGSVQERKRGH